MSTTSTTYTSGYTDYGNVQFTTSTDNSWMSYESFLNLMILEIQNQDFLSETDNNDMLDTMATISNMQAMEQISYQMETSYAIGMVGKVVTASRYTVSGNLDTTTGVVDKVSIYDGEYILYIGGKTYTLDQIMEIGTDQIGALQTEDYDLSVTDLQSTQATLNWYAPTEDLLQSAELTYSVYYSTDSDFSTVDQVENGTLVGTADQSNVYVTNITDLEPQTTYYANVVVTNTDGSKSVFSPIEFTTLIGA